VCLTTRDIAATALATLLTTSTFAADRTGAPDATPSVEEIIVTPQKREERLQDVPISIVAVTAGQLAAASVRGVKDLPRLVPNFSITRAAQSAGLRLAVRGIGTLGNSAIEPSVAPFMDGIYVPRSGMVFASFLDIDTIEVLRGPQGTMFGRNASMGALVMRSAQPNDRSEASVKAETATGDRQRLEATVNAPLSDGAAVRIAALGEVFGGYWTNTLGGGNLAKQNQIAGRLSTKLHLGEAVTWTVRLEGAAISGAEYPNLKLDYRTVSAAGLAGLTRLLGANIPDPDLYDRRNNVIYPERAGSHDKQWAASSELDWAADSGYTLKLLDGFRDWRNAVIDGGTVFLPVPTVERDSLFRSASQSHELQLITPPKGSPGSLFGGRFDAVAGAYYFREHYGVGETNLGLAQWCPLVVTNVAPALATSCAAGELTVGRFDQWTGSAALYAEGHTEIIPNLELITGLRWTDERKHGSFVQTVPGASGTVLRAAEATPLQFAGDRVNWRAGLDWHATEDVMVFAAASTGYKSGGFNSAGSGVALGLRRIYAPETTADKEIGVKTRWFERRLVIDATLYRVDIHGYQDRAFDGIGFVVRNVGSLRHQGLELDTQAQLHPGLRLNFAAAYLDSKFTKYTDAANLPGLPGTQDLTGRSASYAPRWSGSTGAEIDGDIASWNWALRADVMFQSHMNAGAATDDNPQALEAGYALLSARATVDSRDRSWSFAVFGENLTDAHYSINAFYQTFDTIFGLRNAGRTALRQTPGNPRTVGVSVTRKF
jgi:iron complex outermembrane receptor protein